MGCKKTENKLVNTWYSSIIKALKSKDVTRFKRAKQISIYRCASTLIALLVRNQTASVGV